MATQTPQTKTLKTLHVGKDKLTAKKLQDETGRPLGSPINGKEVGDKFNITLTGNVEIREFNGQKGAYFTSKEGISVRVNASFDPAVHKEGAVMECICRELVTADRSVKFAAFLN